VRRLRVEGRELELKTLSVAPRAFVLDDYINETEADHLIALMRSVIITLRGKLWRGFTQHSAGQTRHGPSRALIRNQTCASSSTRPVIASFSGTLDSLDRLQLPKRADKSADGTEDKALLLLPACTSRCPPRSSTPPKQLPYW
jgi:hypothetical protein